MGPNQTAARRGGRLTMKTCAVPHSVCATISSGEAGRGDGEALQPGAQGVDGASHHVVGRAGRGCPGCTCLAKKTACTARDQACHPKMKKEMKERKKEG